MLTTTFFPPYHLGGDAIHVQQLSQELAKLGHDVHVLHSVDAYRLKRNDRPEDTSPAEGIGLHPFKSPLGRISPLMSYVAGFPYPHTTRITQLINGLKPDVLHHHNVSLLGPFMLGISSPVKLYTAHDYWLVCPQSSLLRRGVSPCNEPRGCFVCLMMSRKPPQLWRYTNALKKGLKNIDLIIAPSHCAKSILEKNPIIGDIAVMPNFVPEPLSSTNNRTNESLYFLYVGVLEQHKGILELVDTFIRIRHSIDTNLLIVGRGSLESEIRRRIKTSGCEKNIKLLGYTSQSVLASLYRRALAVIIPPTWSENCPLVAIEALANGTPLIVSKSGGLPELVKEPELGFVYASSEELQNILVGFCKDEFNQKVIREAYHSRYSSPVYVQNLFTCIERAADIVQAD